VEKVVMEHRGLIEIGTLARVGTESGPIQIAGTRIHSPAIAISGAENQRNDQENHPDHEKDGNEDEEGGHG
jgi:hypothetical protein